MSKTKRRAITPAPPVPEPIPPGDGIALTVGGRAIAVTNREGAVAAREDRATLREDAAGSREGAAGLRDETADRREEAAELRDETSLRREGALLAREQAADAEPELARLMAQMREANERLVVGAVRAQTMTEDLEHANRVKDEFLATVSHELRTPLNAIMGWTRMLGSMQLPPDRAEHALAVIERNASALAHIIDDLLDVSRIVAGTLQLTTQPVDLVAVTQAALDAVGPLASTKNVHLAFSPDLAAMRNVSGDASRLQQVIWNLLSNAITFTPRGGRVSVFIDPSDDRMVIRVVDAGEGISPDFLPHVFERFRQADGATTRRTGGLGLGLAIVRQLVELHRGTVHAASEGVGFGATFTVCLPISPGGFHGGDAPTLGERRTGAFAASPMPLLPRLDALRILVVDDNIDGRTLTALVLTQAGATVKAVATVREARQIFIAERPDALVSDIGLPEEDGYALIRQIRQFEAEHGGCIPAIALTGFARAEDRARSLAAGFQEHLSKPVDPADLTAVVASIAHARRKGEPNGEPPTVERQRDRPTRTQ